MTQQIAAEHSAMKFDSLLVHIGGFGTYQKRQFILTGIPALIIACHQLAAVFLTATPEFRCAIPSLNGTDSYGLNINNLSAYIPYSNMASGPKIDTCHVYATPSVINSSTVKCNEYVYSTEYFDKTIVTEWNLVCDSKVKATLSTTLYMVGRLLGALVFGFLSDIVGRKKVMILCIFMMGSAGMGGAFAPNYAVFVVLRLIVGAAGTGLYMTLFILGVEMLDQRYRMYAGILNSYFFGTGYVLLAGIAYVSRNSTNTQIAISAPVFLFLSYIWLVPESARWLLNKNRSDEAYQILQKAAQVNKVGLPKELELEQEQVKASSLITLFKAKTLLIRTVIIFLNWLAIGAGYYSLSLASGTIDGNTYLIFTLSGAIEIFSVTASLLVNKVGRKGPHIFGLLVGAVSSIATVMIDQFGAGLDQNLKNNLFIALNIIGKFGLTIGFVIVFIWSAEIFPTSLRTSLMGLGSTAARIGTIVAPFLADLGKYVPEKYVKVIQSGIIGSIVLLSALLAFLLPETLGQEMPETVEQANNLTLKAATEMRKDEKDEKFETDECKL